MQIDTSTSNLAATLIERVQATVKPSHNLVEVSMTNLSRRMWNKLVDALTLSDRFTHKTERCGMVYVLDDGTIAQRLGSDVSMATLADVQHVPVKCACAKKKGVLVDVPTVSMRLATTSCAKDASGAVARVVKARQYVLEHKFTNAGGYEYVLSLRTPLGHAADSEKALERSELQIHTFSVRFSVNEPQHSALYHALNVLNLAEQVFHPSLQLRLS